MPRPARAVILTATNSSHAETLSMPGHPQYRITGNESGVGRTLEVANADGSWSKVGDVSVRADQNSTTVDMAEVNGALKDRGFDPIGPLDTSLPGTPIDAPQPAFTSLKPIKMCFKSAGRPWRAAGRQTPQPLSSQLPPLTKNLVSPLALPVAVHS